jgi:hypothetical protein
MTMVATPARTPAEQALAARYPAERTSLPGTADVIAIRDAAFGGVEKSGCRTAESRTGSTPTCGLG